MKTKEETIKSGWSLAECFQQLRFDTAHHLGMGDIRITIGQQEEIVDLVEIDKQDYAKEVAIGFAEWCDDNEWTYHINHQWAKWDGTMIYKTTAELYDIFITN